MNSLIGIFLPSGAGTTVTVLGIAANADLMKSSVENKHSADCLVRALIIAGYSEALPTDASVFSMRDFMSFLLSAVARADSLRKRIGRTGAFSGRSFLCRSRRDCDIADILVIMVSNWGE